jgi:DNA-binding CsgD family transcriptional regulator
MAIIQELHRPNNPPDTLQQHPCFAPTDQESRQGTIRQVPPAGRDELVRPRPKAPVDHRSDGVELPFSAEVEVDPRLLRTAMPTIDQLAAGLVDAPIAIVLANRKAQIAVRRVGPDQEAERLDRISLAVGFDWSLGRAGTNGVGEAVETGSPSLVLGDEHSLVAMTARATAAAPIRDPSSALLLGALALICHEEVVNSLLTPVTLQAARTIELRLLEETRTVGSKLRSVFSEARRRTRGALAMVTADDLWTNPLATRTLAASDQSALWRQAVDHLASATVTESVLTQSDGTEIPIALEAVTDRSELVGALVRLPTTGSRRRGFRESSGPDLSRGRPSFGSESLTAAEEAVSELVAVGLTNREVAERLYLSPHTVDSHLRHIFRKLDISSRVQLARLISQQASV